MSGPVQHGGAPGGRSTTQAPVQAGSVRRARQQLSADLQRGRRDGQEVAPSESPSQAQIDAMVNRSLAQLAAGWPADGQRPRAAPSASQEPPSPPAEMNSSFRFPFPHAPPPAAAARRNREPAPPSSRRPGPQYYTSREHVSPIVEESTESIASRSVFSVASSGVLAAAARANLPSPGPNFYYEESPASTPPLPPAEPRIVARGSPSNRARPAVKTIQIGRSPGQPATPDLGDRDRDRAVHTRPQTRESQISALSAVVAQGMHPSPPTGLPTSPRPQNRRGPDPRSGPQAGGLGLRMPFHDDSPPISPQSGHSHADLSVPGLVDRNQTISSHSRSPLLTPSSAHLNAPRPGMSEKIGADRRPPDLDLPPWPSDANSDRASTTSLTDLIRRATKLAANLDRGKTASRLGMLDMFYGDGEKPRNRRTEPKLRRESGISDMLSSFPQPETPGSAWPESGLKMELPLSHDREPTPARPAPPAATGRRCCGMRMGRFVTLVLVLVLLVAAAVLVPLFLIVFPNMRNHQRASAALSVAACQKSWPCDHGGVTVVIAATNQCGCVCVNGFTGQHCDTQGLSLAAGGACTTSGTPVDGISDATMGSSLPHLFASAQQNFSIPLDGKSILALLSKNSVDCQAEEGLVTFHLPTQAKSKRFDILPGHREPDRDAVAVPPVRHAPSPPKLLVTQRPPGGGVLRADRAKRNPSPEGSSVATSNGVVFQTTTTDAPSAVRPSTAATSASGSGSASSTSSAPSSASSTASAVSETAFDFSGIVVLYVLEQSGQVDVAVNAQQLLSDFLAQGSRASGSVEVGFGDLDVSAVFPDGIVGALSRSGSAPGGGLTGGMRIVWGNGTVVGMG